MTTKEKLLFQAIQQGDIVHIKSLIEQGVDVQATNEEGRGALHEILKKKPNYYRVELVRLFLTHGANPNAKDKAKQTPLHIECLDPSDPTMIKLLLEHGADVNAVSQTQRTPLHVLCDVEWREPLHIVSLRALLEAGANVHALDGTHKTPLHYMMNNPNIEMIELLLKAGANINAIDKTLRTPLHYVEYSPAEQTVNSNADDPDQPCLDGEENPLQKKEQAEATQFLLDQGAHLHATDNEGHTSLHWAVILHQTQNENSHLLVLLERGAEVNAVNNKGETALHLAARGYNGVEPVKILLQWGADPTVPNHQGKTPLEIAQGLPIEVFLRKRAAELEQQQLQDAIPKDQEGSGHENGRNTHASALDRTQGRMRL